MNAVKQLEQILSERIESKSSIRADDGNWEVQVEEGNDSMHIPSGALIFANNRCSDVLIKPLLQMPSDCEAVYNFGGKEKVELGDETMARGPLRKKAGRVTNIPGVLKNV